MNDITWSYLVFAVCVIAFIYDRIVGIRVLGLAEIVFGVQMFRRGRIPFGWEGRPASGYLTGWTAKLASLLAICLGILFTTMPGLVESFF